MSGERPESIVDTITQALVEGSNGGIINQKYVSRLERLGLVVRDTSKKILLSDIGRSIVESNTLGESGVNIDGVRKNIRDLLDKHTSEERQIRKAIGIPDYSNSGLLGRYLQNLPESRRAGTVSGMRTFFQYISVFHEAIGTSETNKLLIANDATSEHSSGYSDIEADIILESIVGCTNILGSQSSQESTKIINIESLVSEINFAKFAIANWKIACGAIVYAVFGIQTPVLREKEQLHKNSRQKAKSLKEIIDTLYKNKIPLSNKEEEIVLFLGNGGSRISYFMGEICSGLKSRNFIRPSYGNTSLQELLKSIPIVGFGGHLKSYQYDHYSGLRQAVIPDSEIPSEMGKILQTEKKGGTPVGTIHLIKDIFSIKGLLFSGVHEPMHIIDVLLKRKRELPSPLEAREIIEYMVETSLTLSTNALIEVLSLGRKNGIENFSDAFWENIKKRLPIEKDYRRLYDQLNKFYNPTPYGKHLGKSKGVKLITNDAGYYKSRPQAIGALIEADKVLETLSHSGSLVYADSTGYGQVALRGEGYIAYSERVREALGIRIMSGEVPESLRNFSLVHIDLAKDPSLMEMFMAIMTGADMEKKANIQEMQQVFLDIVRYNPESIVVLSIPKDKIHAKTISEVVKYAESLNIKIIIEGEGTIPGIESTVYTYPINSTALEQRIMKIIPELSINLGVTFDETTVKKGIAIICRSMKAGTDPLQVTIEVMANAANRVKAKKSEVVSDIDFSAALSFVLGLIGNEGVSEKIRMLTELPSILKREIIGQDRVIDGFCRDLLSHSTGGGNAEKPLAYLFPGPTGVGKTLLADILNKNMNLPLLIIDGSTYQEAHTLSRLTSSPPGYVGSDKDGVLTGFMKQNPMGIVFIDEIDKMHPSVRTALMNFADKGSMTDGSGEILHRPQYTIIVATNAGAEKLSSNMTRSDIIACISEAFAGEDGKPKPEIAARYRISPMLAISEESFKKAIKKTLLDIQFRQSFISNGINISEVSEEAIELIFRETSGSCKISASTNPSIGFTQPKNIAQGGYINLRQITHVVDPYIGVRITSKILTGGIPPGNYKLIVEDGEFDLIISK